ncbi:Heterokaryon incompatibility protein 6, OR allele [Colletotrichum sp. SAR 10_65]|nr:Heterokaryon incompatibility protein 6, OR allele [Colletotrichum sp. SAR 10_65]
MSGRRCTLWTVIQDQLTSIEAEAKSQKKQRINAYDLDDYHENKIEAHEEKLAASVDASEANEYPRLRKRLFWDHGEVLGDKEEFPVGQNKCVRVTMGYSAINDFKDRNVMVYIGMLISKGFPETASPDRGEVELVQYSTRFLALSLPDSMPSLVIDVSDPGRSRLLRVPENMRERYIALSYCWGGVSQAIMLRTGNMSDLTSSIDPQKLDPTIRDSITVTRELGFKFLWIDALCIIQDDYDDKVKELRRMGDIYQNATFTIVASAAKDVKEGFLGKRAPTYETTGNPDGQVQPVFEVQAEVDEPTGHEKQTMILIPDKLDEMEPWYERAWTLQELLFSRRRLQYRARQTTWICHCSESLVEDCDGWIGGMGNTYINYSDQYLFRGLMALLRGGESAPPKTEILSHWYDLVEVYSGRKLSHRADRFPAISGIAREFAALLEDQYICGLWRSDLARGLMWFSTLMEGDAVLGYKSGPSWSWASFEGRASWMQQRHTHWRQNQDFEVLGDDIQPVSEVEPFGEVKVAELHLRGLIKSIPIPSADENGFMQSEVRDEIVSIGFDYPNDDRLQLDCGLTLELLVVVDSGDLGVEGLVLMEEGENRYSRVGLFEMDSIWPVKSSHRWEEEHTRGKKSLKEHQARLRSLWGEESIREIVLI